MTDITPETPPVADDDGNDGPVYIAYPQDPPPPDPASFPEQHPVGDGG